MLRHLSIWLNLVVRNVSNSLVISIKEVFEALWSVLRSSEVLIHDETVEDAAGSKVENSKEERCNHVSNETDDNCWNIWLLNLWSLGLDQKNCQPDRSCNYCTLADKIKDPSNDNDRRESSNVTN